MVQGAAYVGRAQHIQTGLDAIAVPLISVRRTNCLNEEQVLLRMLEDLKVNTFASATLAEAEQVLSRHGIALVFCDDRLTDGSYRDLLQTLRTWKKAPHIVVTTRIGEWKDYLEALQLGASEMIQYPYRSMSKRTSFVLCAAEINRSMRYLIDTSIEYAPATTPLFRSFLPPYLTYWM